MIKKTFHIPDMHCPSCVLRVEGIEDELDGVFCASASYHKGQVIIEYDEKKVSTDQILETLRNFGYPAHEG